jgi:hypothetical protein
VKLAAVSFVTGALVIAVTIVIVGSGALYRYYPYPGLKDPKLRDNAQYYGAMERGCEPVYAPGLQLSVPAAIRCPFWITP